MSSWYACIRSKGLYCAQLLTWKLAWERRFPEFDSQVREVFLHLLLLCSAWLIWMSQEMLWLRLDQPSWQVILNRTGELTEVVLTILSPLQTAVNHNAIGFSNWSLFWSRRHAHCVILLFWRALINCSIWKTMVAWENGLYSTSHWRHLVLSKSIKILAQVNESYKEIPNYSMGSKCWQWHSSEWYLDNKHRV